MNKNEKWSRCADALSSEIDTETVVLSIQADKYISMEGVAGRIWELIEQPVTLNDICSQLMAEYKVDETTCLAQTHQFLNSLLEKKIAEVV